MLERPLTEHLPKDGGVLSLAEYERVGGYQGLRKALTMTPLEVQGLVKEANLRGRGGAGFPTGVKWGAVPMGEGTPRQHYLVCNADEMEPGTFKDRILLEGNPHQLIEGMVIAAYAIQASVGYVFLRWAYRLAAERLRVAFVEAGQAGYLGENILGSGFAFGLNLHESAGRYICGEESALLNSLEGKRATPRSRPPFPQVSGLWGKPTIVNNVETLCNVPHILHRGAEWYKALGAGKDAGTKIYGVSGKVKRPGLWELPIGTTIREILEVHAGGMEDGVSFRGVLPGGASTDFLVEQHLDTAMDYDSVMAAGSRLGTGTMIVLDDKSCPVGMILALERFFAQESCGWCSPCREGLPWVVDTLTALESGEGVAEDLVVLKEHCRMIGPIGRTFCALAPGAMEPLQSGMKYFGEDFKRHVEEKRCPWS